MTESSSEQQAADERTPGDTSTYPGDAQQPDTATAATGGIGDLGDQQGRPSAEPSGGAEGQDTGAAIDLTPGDTGQPASDSGT